MRVSQWVLSKERTFIVIVEKTKRLWGSVTADDVCADSVKNWSVRPYRETLSDIIPVQISLVQRSANVDAPGCETAPARLG